MLTLFFFLLCEVKRVKEYHIIMSTCVDLKLLCDEGIMSVVVLQSPQQQLAYVYNGINAK